MVPYSQHSCLYNVRGRSDIEYLEFLSVSWQEQELVEIGLFNQEQDAIDRGQATPKNCLLKMDSLAGSFKVSPNSKILKGNFMSAGGGSAQLPGVLL